MKIALLFCIILSTTLSYADICGRITSLRGAVEVLRLKNEKDKSTDRLGIIAQNKMSLWCSDIIVSRKAARAKIRLKNHATLTLGPHSRIEILNHINNTTDVNQLKLTYGKVRALFHDNKAKKPKKLPEKKDKNSNNFSRLIIKTPSVVAGVRGTDFYISYSPIRKKTEQATIEGQVLVENEVTQEKIIVDPGKQVAVDLIAPEVATEIKAELKKGKNLQQIQREKGLDELAVEPIKEVVKEEIRQTSAIARNDKDFTSQQAVEILGAPEKWQLPPDEIPLDLKDIKEEF
ncbi:MAG: FecR domain-containing protein [Bdellovibrionales bacterium]|nr:FecR domain-containing protein [Bdellovibrionales bacterium]